MASHKIIVQNLIKEDKKEYLGKCATFEYQLCDADKSENRYEKLVLPFPPYKTSRNFEILAGLVSISAPFISDKTYADVENSPILSWIYSYKINYPHMPNFFDLILAIGIAPDKLDIRDPAAIRFTIHQFLKSFGEQARITIKDYSLAIPKNNTVFRKADDDMIAFIPTLTPIASFTIKPIAQKKKDDQNSNINDQGFAMFPFPTTLNLKYKLATPTKDNEINGPAFTSDILNTNANQNTNANANTNINANNKDQEIVNNYNFYGGLFESSDKPMRYVLIKVDNIFYKHELFTNNESPINEVFVIDPNQKDASDFNPRDSCIAAFFIKENGKIKPKRYQKL